MTFEVVVKFDGTTPDGESESKVFQEAFSPVRRVFDYPDLRDAVLSLVKGQAEEHVIRAVHGGLDPNNALDHGAVQTRYAIAKFLLSALENDLLLDYGVVASHGQVIREARLGQIARLREAILILRDALIRMDEVVVEA